MMQSISFQLSFLSGISLNCLIDGQGSLNSSNVHKKPVASSRGVHSITPGLMAADVSMNDERPGAQDANTDDDARMAHAPGF